MGINPIVGVYIPIIRIPIKGGMTIRNIATFDHGTYIYIYTWPEWWWKVPDSYFQEIQYLRRDSNELVFSKPSKEWRFGLCPASIPRASGTRSPRFFSKARDECVWKTYGWWFRNPVNSPVEVGSLSHHLQGSKTSQVVIAGILKHQQYLRNAYVHVDCWECL